MVNQIDRTGLHNKLTCDLFFFSQFESLQGFFIPVDFLFWLREAKTAYQHETLTSYHTNKFDRKTTTHLASEIITSLSRYLFDCLEVFFTRIKYLTQFKWIRFPSAAIENVTT